MSTTISQTLGAYTAFSGLTSALAAVTYDVSAAVDLGTPTPIDCILEVEVTVTSTNGNKQCKVFIKASLDNSAWSTGPESGTTTTDEPDLHLIGVVPLNNTGSTLHRKQFSILKQLGFCPRYLKLVRFNDAASGAAFTSSAAHYATVVGTAA